ncbi:hypothetical protein V12B01_13025 [Vibrio splendidus 12B01]|nr:hypothetical protein V12B01_13025 [Vibrio splendidus 12B01]EAQ54985.1 hypothetical protein MED222_05205 [Vibrio sp. MED222]
MRMLEETFEGLWALSVSPCMSATNIVWS